MNEQSDSRTASMLSLSTFQKAVSSLSSSALSWLRSSSRVSDRTMAAMASRR